MIEIWFVLLVHMLDSGFGTIAAAAGQLRPNSVATTWKAAHIDLRALPRFPPLGTVSAPFQEAGQPVVRAESLTLQRRGCTFAVPCSRNRESPLLAWGCSCRHATGPARHGPPGLPTHDLHCLQRCLLEWMAALDDKIRLPCGRLLQRCLSTCNFGAKGRSGIDFRVEEKCAGASCCMQDEDCYGELYNIALCHKLSHSQLCVNLHA